jgi:hypothetical protein
MLNYSVATKSQLAKLLATENIKIEHQNAPTASFNLKTRTLTCPIWKDMTGQMYDLLLGHEVSHALETPEQGWHNAVCTKGVNYRHFLNVVEDARIEKKIKRRYPGIRRSFIGAYKQLLDENFFGIKDKDLDDLFFIDRINVYCKAGVSSGITFNNAEEKRLLKLVEDAETWNDVLYATEQIWEYSKQEQQQEMPAYVKTATWMQADDQSDSEFKYIDNHFDDEFDEEFDSGESEGDADFDEFDNEAESEEGGNSGDTESNQEEDGSENDDSSDDALPAKGIDGDKDTLTFGEPVCETDITFRENEKKLLSDKVQRVSYINIPKLIKKDLIKDAKSINTFMTNFFEAEKYKMNELYNSFKSKNDKYIGLLVKEFEMRKAAKAHSRSKLSDTGDININKLSSYQFDDEIFRKAMIVPKGKSHGLFLLLDMSGSMGDSMSGSIEQILVLTAFCKKVNIPFQVFGFSSGQVPDDCFEKVVDGLTMRDFKLIEFINSKMKTTEYNTAIKNLCGLAHLYTNRYAHHVPHQLKLGRTPLIESMVTLQPLIKQFKKQNNLDIVNMVIVHDGDADTIDTYSTPGQYFKRINNLYTERFVLRDLHEKLDFPIEYDEDIGLSESMRQSIFKWFVQTTGTKLFGFFITNPSSSSISTAVRNRYVDVKVGIPKFENYSQEYTYYNTVAEKLKKERWLHSKNYGYESFFLIVGGKNLQIENEELVVTGKVSKKTLFTALRRLTKNKVTNRVLVSKFIEGIAI